jgi:hypothetical protein
LFVFVCMFSCWSQNLIFLVLFWSFWCFLVATRVEGARIVVFNGFFVFFLLQQRVRVGGTRFFLILFFGVFSCYNRNKMCKNFVLVFF